VPEGIDHGRTGFLCDVGDAEGMAERGIELVRDRELGRRIGQAAAAEVRAHYCVDNVVPRYEAFYEEVLAGTAGTTGTPGT
jgi:glycosyltransferase involved in cell wall biosynthesis